MRRMTRPLPHLLMGVLCGAILPAVAMAATDADRRSACAADPGSCPAWMPSQADMRALLRDYYCGQIDRGRLQPPVLPLASATTSSVNCGTLSPADSPSYVCGGEMAFVGKDGERYFLGFSPTLRQEDDGRTAVYEGDHWQVVEPLSATSACPAAPRR